MPHRLRPEDLSFVERAPIVVRAETTVAASPAEVWPAFADAPAWTQWFTGMKDAHYTSAAPFGVGSTRSVHVLGLRRDDPRFRPGPALRLSRRRHDPADPRRARRGRHVRGRRLGHAGRLPPGPRAEAVAAAADAAAPGEAVTMLVPPAWQNDPRVDDDERAMHRYHAMLVEPWDGPAGLVYTDGVVCGAALDRNGLRPLRVAVCSDGLVTVSSEAVAIPLSEESTVRRARLGPGQQLSIDPERGLLFDGELKRELARRKPFEAWVDATIAQGSQGEPAQIGEADLTSRHALYGYTREELSLMLRPIAQSGGPGRRARTGGRQPADAARR